MSLVFVGLGSNLGDGRFNLQLAWRKIGEYRGVSTLALSSPYLSRPLMKKEWVATGHQLGTQWFTNAAGVLETGLTPLALLGVIHEVEIQLGRERQKTVDRVVDLDILYFDDLIYRDDRLVLPHPEIGNRLFVLAPLEELAPDRQHPATGMTTRQMRRALAGQDATDIRRLVWPAGTNSKGAC